MKKKIFKSLVCVGMLVCMVGCSAGDNGANENNTELTGQVEENIQDTTEEDLQTYVENELDASQTDDVQEALTESDVATTDETVEEDMVTENQTAEGTEAEFIPEEPEVEMVDFETWAKQEGNEECCLVVWNEELRKQEIMPTVQETKKSYEVQDGDRFAIPYNEKIEVLKVGDEIVIWGAADEYLEVFVDKGDVKQVSIVVKDEQGDTKSINYILKYL